VSQPMGNHMQSKQAVLTGFGTPDNIVTQVVDIAPPQPNEVQVQVEASTVTATDTMIRRGLYPLLRQAPPFTMGYDFVGHIEAIGANVTDFAVGDRVAHLVQIGGNTSRLNVPAEGLLHVPDDIDVLKISPLILSGMTAYQIFTHHAKLQRGQAFLVHGGSGAVGSTLLQLCKHHGIRTVTTASAGKHNAIAHLADEMIDYRAPNYGEQLKQAAGDGFDAVFDFTNHASFNRSFDLLKKGGVLIAAGIQTLSKQVEKKTTGAFALFTLDFVRLLATLTLWDKLPNGKSTSFFGILTSKQKQPRRYQDDLDALLALVRDGHIDPLVHATLPIEQTALAHQILENGHVIGNVVIQNQA
jgi:NADPH:quinone reductase